MENSKQEMGSGSWAGSDLTNQGPSDLNRAVHSMETLALRRALDRPHREPRKGNLQGPYMPRWRAA
jgi:hypothetical protein